MEDMGTVIPYPTCLPPETRNGIVRINCSNIEGGVYFYDESTGETISVCTRCNWLKDDKMKHACKTECPPKEWPLEIPNCDNQVAESILGTWRLDSHLVLGVFGPISHDGWSITITDHAMLFDFHGIVQFERSIAVVDTNNRHVVLELQDDSGETDTVTIRFMPCGLMFKPDTECSAFCKNLNSEFSKEDYRAISKLTGHYLDDATIEKIIEQAPRRPFFSGRDYFREVISN